jgi:hypothetical protein
LVSALARLLFCVLRGSPARARRSKFHICLAVGALAAHAATIQPTQKIRAARVQWVHTPVPEVVATADLLVIDRPHLLGDTVAKANDPGAAAFANHCREHVALTRLSANLKRFSSSLRIPLSRLLSFPLLLSSSSSVLSPSLVVFVFQAALMMGFSFFLSHSFLFFPSFGVFHFHSGIRPFSSLQPAHAEGAVY